MSGQSCERLVHKILEGCSVPPLDIIDAVECRLRVTLCKRPKTVLFSERRLTHRMPACPQLVNKSTAHLSKG